MNARVMLAAAMLLLLVISPGTAQDSRYKGIESAETVTIIDSKGVVTEASGFGKMFGPPYLKGFRGDSSIEVPFERITELAAGEVVDNRLTVTLTLVTGRTLQILLDRPEFDTTYAGTAEFGYFRIRLCDVKSLTFHRVRTEREGLGLRCAKGHIWYNDTWRFCPYDGEKLVAIVQPTAEKE